MATPPTFVAATTTAWNTTADKTTSSYAVVSGDFLVAVGAGENWASSLDNITISGGPTWTERQTARASGRCSATVSSGQAGSTTSYTTTFADLSATQWMGGSVLQFRNHGGLGTSNKSNTAGMSFTTTADNSAVVMLVVDYSAVDGSARTWRTVNGVTPTSGNGYEIAYFRDAAHYALYVGYYPDVGAAGAKAIGLSAPVGGTFTILALEVLGTVSAGAITGAISSALSMSGVLTGTGALAGSINDALAVSGALRGAGALATAIPGTLAVAGALSGAGAVTGAVPLSLGVSGLLRGAGALTSTVPITLTQAGSLTGAGRLQGACTLALGVSGTLTNNTTLVGSVHLQSSASGLLMGSGRLQSTIPISTAPAGTLSGSISGALVGSASLQFTIAGILSGLRSVPTPRARSIVVGTEHRNVVLAKPHRTVIPSRSRRQVN